MKRLLVCLLCMGVVGCDGGSSPPNDSQAKAESVIALKKLGAYWELNEQGEVVFVNFMSTQITDAGLVNLKALTGLQTLSIGSDKIIDAGLVHIKELTNLQKLDLSGNKITDAGLVHLEGLTYLLSLELYGTKITDAGLVYLKGLTNLTFLTLSKEVTDAGLAELRKALPDCDIRH
jgi:hypothetical protein